MAKASTILKLLGVGAGIAAATPSDAEAKFSMKLPKQLSLANVVEDSRAVTPIGKGKVSDFWEISKANRYLMGKEFKDKVIDAVYRPNRTLMPERALPGSDVHNLYKASDLYPTEKRLITFRDGSYMTVDKEDLTTIVTRLGLDDYMGTLPTPGEHRFSDYAGHTQALRSVQNRLTHGHHYSSLKDRFEELIANPEAFKGSKKIRLELEPDNPIQLPAEVVGASRLRKHNAQQQMEIFGDMNVGYETVQVAGRYLNLPSPYAETIRKMKDIPDNAFLSYIRKFDRNDRNMLLAMRNAKLFKDESTFLSKYGFKNKRSETLPEHFEDVIIPTTPAQFQAQLSTIASRGISRKSSGG